MDNMKESLKQENTYEGTDLKQETDATMNIAMDDYLAGAPIIPEPEQVLSKIDTADSTPPVTDSFTTRQEVMSKLNLVDENFNYTDTYTNYIDRGGTPPPGYEYAHNQILKEERTENIFNKVQNNEISFETGLMDAYGKDILSNMGIKVDSVNYWMNKYMSNDFSNPFNNKILMNSVKEQALQMYQGYMTNQGSRSTVSSNTLSNLVNEELSGKQVRDLFGDHWNEGINELSNDKLLEMINTDAIDSASRLIKDEKGTFYYLYNDGKLYELDNTSGEGHAHYDKDEDGNITGIYIGGKGKTHIKAFTSGFAGVFTSIAKFAGNIGGSAVELVKSVLGDDYDWDDATAAGRNIDAFLNKNANFLNSSGYIDLDKDFSLMDLSHMGANLLGSVAGVYTLGAGMNALSKAGDSLISFADTGVTKFHGAKALGYITKGSAKALKWQTGNFGNVATGDSFLRKIGTRAGTASLYNVKDFFQNVQTLSTQRNVLDNKDEISDGEIFGRALSISAVNTIIDTAIGGGIDDNFVQTFTGRDASKTATEALEQVMSKYTKDEIASGAIDAVSNKALKDFLKSNNNVIRFNTVMDFASNYLTGIMSSHASYDADGEFRKFSAEDFIPFKKEDLGLIIPAAFNSYAYSYRGQKNEYNIAFDKIRTIHSTILSDLDTKIANTKNAQEISVLNQVRADYVKSFNNSKSGTAEGKILDALDNMATKLQTDPNTVPDFMKKAINKVVVPEKLNNLRSVYETSEKLFEARLAYASGVLKPETNNSKHLLGFIKNKLLKEDVGADSLIKRTLTNKGGQAKEALRTEMQSQNIIAKIGDYAGIYSFNPTISKAMDNLSSGVNDDDLSNLDKKSKFLSIVELKKTDEDTYNKVASRMSNEDMANSFFIKVDNTSESNDKDAKLIHSAYKLCSDLSLIKEVYEGSKLYAFTVSDNIDAVNMSTVLHSMLDASIKLQRSSSVIDYKNTIVDAMTVLGVKDDTALVTKTNTALTFLKSAEESKLLSTKEAAEIFKELAREGKIDKTDYSLSVSKNKKAIDFYNRYKSINDVLKAITTADKNPAKFKSAIDLSDSDTQKAIKELLDSKDIPQELKDEITKVNTESYFQSGDTKGFYSFVQYSVKNHFTNHLVSPEVEEPISSTDDTITKEGLELYVKRIAPDSASAKEIESLSNDLFNTWNNIYKDTTQSVTMRDDTIFIDLRNITGKYTDQLIRDIKQKESSGIKDFDDYNSVKNKARIAAEFDTRSQLIANNSPIISIDLHNQRDIDFFNTIMRNLNYGVSLKNKDMFEENKNTIRSNIDLFGINYGEESLRVMKTPHDAELSSVLTKAFIDGYIKLDSGKKLLLNDVEFLDYAGNKTSKPDVVTSILSSVELKNISPEIKANLKQLSLLEVLPFCPQETYTKNSLATSLLKGLSELKIKVGKAAGSSEKVLESLPIKTAATLVKTNEDLANYFAITMVIDKLFEDNAILQLNTKDLKTLKEKGIINSENSYWKSFTRQGQGYIQLKDYSDDAKMKMKQDILKKDFNLLKVLPFINYDLEQQDKLIKKSASHGFVDSSNDLKVYMGSKAGGNRKLGLSVLNIAFPWDNEDRAFASKFFRDLLDAGTKDTYYINPLKDHKFKDPEFSDTKYKLQDASDMNALYKTLKGKKQDPYSMLLKTYIDTFDTLMKYSKDSKDTENWRLILKSRKAIQDFNSLTELTDTDIKRIQEYFKQPKANVLSQDGLVTMSSRLPVYTSRGSKVPVGHTQISSDILANILGGYDNLFYTKEDGSAWVPKVEDLQKAFEEFSIMKTDIIENNSSVPYRFINPRYIESNATKLFTLAGSLDGYLRIEDAEDIAQLISANYNAVLEDAGIDFKLTSDTDTLGVLKVLFGSQYKDAVETIFNQAKKNMSITNKFGPVSIKEKFKSSSPSKELTSSVALSRGGDNLDTMSDLLQNRINRELNKRKFGEWEKMTSQTTDYNDYENINSARREHMENLKLEEEQYGNYSKSFIFSANHNAKGPQYATVATWNNLLKEFKPIADISNDNVKNKLMDLSILLNDMFIGRTDYSGKSTKYIIVDSNSLEPVDMEEFTAESLSELLLKLSNNKNTLKNSIILTADPKAAGSTTALNIKYNYLKDSNTYNNFVTDLYHKWILDNEYSIKKALNMKDTDSVLDILGSAKLDDKTIKVISESIPSYSISEKEETKLLWQQVRDTGVDITKKDFYKLFKYPLDQYDSYKDAKDRYTAARNLIDNELGLSTEYKDLSRLEQQRINFIAYGLDPSLLTKTHKIAITKRKEAIKNHIHNAEALHYMNEYFKGNVKSLTKLKELYKTNPEIKQDLLLAQLIEDDSAANIDLIARDRSLAQMYKERNSAKSYSSLVISKDGDTIPTQEMRDLFDSIDNNTKNKTNITTLISFDTEASNISKNKFNEDYIFNLSTVIYKYEEGKWNTYNKVYNIKYDVDPREWINKNVDTSNSFYINNKGYREDLENYKNSTDAMTPSEIKDSLLANIDPNKTLLIGHNIDSADTPWLTNTGIFDSNLLSKVKTLDTLYVANTNLKDNRAGKSLKKNDLLELLTNINNKESAHSSLQDSIDTLDILKSLVNLDFDINKLRTKEIKNLESFANTVGFNLTKEDFKQLDSTIKEIKDETSEYKDAFNSKYQITNDSVSTIRDAFNYRLKKDYMKMIYDIRSKDASLYNLSSKAQSILNSESYANVFKLFSYAQDNNIDEEKILKSIKENIQGFASEESILLTLGDKKSFDTILKDLNIQEEDLKNYSTSTAAFKKYLSNTDILNSDRFKNYESSRGTYIIGDALQKAIGALNINNESINNLIADKMLTFFDIDNDIEDVNSYLNKVKPTLIESKYDKTYNEILKSRFGNVKALFNIPQKGKYSLITSFKTNTKYKDLISGTTITSDASMAILTKRYFESLMGMSFEDYKKEHPKQKELYSDMLIHPADGNNKVLARRLIVVDSFNDTHRDLGLRIPETLAEVLVARDFDGDHVVLIQPDERSQSLLKSYSNIMYKTHDVQENILNWLTLNKQLPYGDTERNSYILHNIGRDKDILDLCFKANRLLEKNQSIPKELTKEFETKVTTLLNSYNETHSNKISIDDVSKELWINKFSTDYYEEIPRDLIYIKNPAVTLNKNLSASYSARIKREIDALAQQRVDQYTVIDSSTGEKGKKLFYTFKPEEITSPFEDMIVNNIYGAKLIKEYMKNISPDDAKEFVDTLSKATMSVGYSNTFLHKVSPTLKNIENDLLDALSKGDTNRASVSYDVYLRTLEDNLRSYHKDSLKNEFKKEDLQNLFKEQEDLLSVKEKGLQLYNDMITRKNNYSSIMDDNIKEKVTYVLNDAIDNLYNSSNKKLFVDTLPNKETAKIFVIESGFPASRDEILYNKKATNKLKVTRSESVTYNPEDRLGTIKVKGKDKQIAEKDILPKGTVLLKHNGKDKIVLNRDAYVVAIDKDSNKIYLTTTSIPDEQIKIITNEGNKGPLNTGYSTDSSIDFIVNADTMSPDKYYTSNNKPIKESDYKTIKLKDSNNKTIEVKGFYIDSVVPMISEDDSTYKTKNSIVDVLGSSDGYAIDFLHHVSDSKTIPGAALMGGWYLSFDDEGKLRYDPSRVQKLTSSIAHPERAMHAHNYIDAIQYYKMAYMINLLDDNEIAKEFNTSLSKQEVIYNKLSDVRVQSEEYNAMINNLVKKYGDRIDKKNPFINKLFSKTLLSKISPSVNTRVSKLNLDNSTSRKHIKEQSTYDNGKSTAQYSLGSIDNIESRDAEDKHYKTYTDLYINPLTALNYLFDDYGYAFTNSKLLDLTKRSLANYGRFKHDAAFSNQYRDTDTQYIQENTFLEPLRTSIYNGDVKSQILEHPYHYNILGDVALDPAITPDQYLIKHNHFINDNTLSNIILKNTRAYDNKMMVLDVINDLSNLKPYMSKEEKLSRFTNKTNLYTISQRLPYFEVTDDGINLNMTKTNYVTDTAKNIESKIRSTVKDFNMMYSVFKSPNKENINFESLMKDSDPSALNKKHSEYNNKVKELDDAMNNVFKTLVNNETGEIDIDTPISKLHKDTSEAIVRPPRLSEDHNATFVFDRDPLLMSSSGLKEQGSPQAMNIARATKRKYSTGLFIAQEPLSKISTLENTLNDSYMSKEEFKEYTTLRFLLSKKDSNIDEYKAGLNYFNKSESDMKNAESILKQYEIKYPHVIANYNKAQESIMSLALQTEQATDEPVGCLALYLSPYKPINKEVRNAQVVSTVNNILNITKFDVTKNPNQSMQYDFFNSSKAIVQELAAMYSTTEISNTLLNPELNMMSNTKLIDSVNKMIDEKINTSNLTSYIKDKEVASKDQDMVMDVIEQYTKINTRSISNDDIILKYKDVYNKINNDLTVMKEKFEATYDGYTIDSLSEAEKIMNLADSHEMKKSAEVIYNYYFSKMICGQGLIESSPTFAKEFSTYLNTLASEGKCLVNKFGQKFERNSIINPISTTSMANFKDNIGIAYNSRSESLWNQFILEKILCGEIYELDTRVADYLEENVYTKKFSSNVTNTFKNISKWSSSLQMALPSKLLNRLISFTGFDYAMSALYNPKSIGKMGQARRELLAAFQSKGASLDSNPVLKRYMELEGQPIGLTGKDPITFSEDISGPDKVMRLLNTLTDPLEFQNHLGRYALYLSALESFEKGDGWYGPVYYKKDQIDKLPTPEDKAMYVMDYMLGSPGGFPMLSKKTSGYMLYATFPMAFTRTLGAWGMSLGKLAQEGFTEANGKQWMRTAVVPSVGLMSITLLASLITSFICDLYDIEEEEKDKLLKKHITIDLIGTALGGTPTASSSSMNPLSNIEEMFITPFKDETYQHGADANTKPSIWKKLFGFTNTNVISHLNPAIKTPIEIATGYDLFGSAPLDTKYYYTGMENAVRKLSGFFIGSNTADAIVNQNKMDSYSKDSNFLQSLTKGIKVGVSNSIGNQKTYKKDTTNYYNNIYKLNNFKYATMPNRNADVEDLIDANYLEHSRSYNSNYGAYDYADYKRISNIMKKMIKSKAEPAQVYALITDEYNKGVSESTLRVVLNNNSIIRKLNQINTSEYLKTLSSKEQLSLVKAIEYEERMYPILDDMFPNRQYIRMPKYDKYKNNYYPKYYGGSRNYFPSYSPRRAPRYIYPTSTNSYRKYKSYTPKIFMKQHNVKVNPEMSIWSNDFNKINDLNKQIRYLDNPFYNSLSDWEKRKKGSDK